MPSIGASGSAETTMSNSRNSSTNAAISAGGPVSSAIRLRSGPLPVIEETDRYRTSGWRALTSHSGSPAWWIRNVTSRMDGSEGGGVQTGSGPSRAIYPRDRATDDVVAMTSRLPPLSPL